MKSKSMSRESAYILFLLGVFAFGLLTSLVGLYNEAERGEYCQKIMETLQKESKK